MCHFPREGVDVSNNIGNHSNSISHNNGYHGNKTDYFDDNIDYHGSNTSYDDAKGYHDNTGCHDNCTCDTGSLLPKSRQEWKEPEGGRVEAGLLSQGRVTVLLGW